VRFEIAYLKGALAHHATAQLLSVHEQDAVLTEGRPQEQEQERKE
jgi:hypothetical protein